MPKWKQDATEFTVSINYNESRGFQSSIPKPIIDFLNLEPSDKLDWMMKTTKDGDKFVIVSKTNNDERIKKLIKKHRGK